MMSRPTDFPDLDDGRKGFRPGIVGWNSGIVTAPLVCARRCDCERVVQWLNKHHPPLPTEKEMADYLRPVWRDIYKQIAEECYAW